MPDFRTRLDAPEWMDDVGITDARLTVALDDLRAVSRLLGGEALSVRAVARHLPADRPARVLDVGTGGADFPAALARRADRHGRDVTVEGVDLNPATLAYAHAWLDRTLPPAARARVTLREADARALPYADGAFDVAHAGLVLHHFRDAEAAALLAELARVARVVVVNDLHRHPLAYLGIRALARLSSSAMFRHDGPVSVLRAFTRPELERIARAAGLDARVSWHWAFRWVLEGRRDGDGGWGIGDGEAERRGEGRPAGRAR